MSDYGLPKYQTHRVLDKKAMEQEVKTNYDQINWAESILNIPSIWWQTRGQHINVAVLDTGIDITHPDFHSAITDTKDFTGDGIHDVNGHGTHVAGIIGARLNGFGFVGVAPNCNLMIGKVLDNSGSGDYQWIADGIHWAIDNGADIINMSLGGAYSHPDMYRAVHRALMEGVVVVCAAGNDGWIDTNNIGYPGRYGGVITVASHDFNGHISGFSSVGGEVDFMAPGDKIWSTYTNGQFAELSGTSMATPFVSGLAALILSKHKATAQNGTEIHNCEDLRSHLMRMATHPGWFDNSRGYGALQPFRYFKK